MFTCRICSSNDLTKDYDVSEMMFGTKKKYKYSQCSSCGVLQIETPIKDIDLLYPQSYYSFSVSRKLSLQKKIRNYLFSKSVAVELGDFSILGFIARKMKVSYEAKSLKGLISKEDEILDIGCGEGELIMALNKLGYKYVSGLDPFINKDIYKKNLVIHKKFTNELPIDKKYDFIMMHHSLEHMESPLEELQNLYKILNEDGKLLIRIPVADSHAFEIYKENWYQLDAPRHVFLHTNKSMSMLASKSGFNINKIINDSLISQFIVSEQYKNGIALNSPDSFYIPIYTRINPFKKKKKSISKQVIKLYKNETEKVNQLGKGDQRIFILTKA